MAGDLVFTIPAGYTLVSVEGADCALLNGDLEWASLSQEQPDPDYTVEGGVVTILGEEGGRLLIRIRLSSGT